MSMLNIGSSALLAAQTALATTSHNISNVNTAGYSRQRTDQAPNLPILKADITLATVLESLVLIVFSISF